MPTWARACGSWPRVGTSLSPTPSWQVRVGRLGGGWWRWRLSTQGGERNLHPLFYPPLAHQAEERATIKEQPADPTQTLPFPDALLQVGWVVQVRGAAQKAAAR